MQRDVVLILGQNGTGKSTLANLYVQSATRVIIRDAGFSEYQAARANTMPELIDHLKARTVNGAGFFRVAYTPAPHEVDSMFDVAMAVNCNDAGQVVNQSLLVLEEADNLGAPDPGSMYEYAIVKGRHDGLSIVAVTLFPAQLSIQLRSQATRLFLFRQTEPAHLKYIEGKVGKDVARLVPMLERFQFIDYDVNAGTTTKMALRKEGEKISLTPLT